MLASSSLTEEGVEGVVSSSDGLVTGHLTIWLDPVLQTIELPAGIANLDTSLTHMDGDTLTLEKEKRAQLNWITLYIIKVNVNDVTKALASAFMRGEPMERGHTLSGLHYI
jgi:hypothetical protein